jgi:carboxypeptidase Q
MIHRATWSCLALLTVISAGAADFKPSDISGRYGPAARQLISASTSDDFAFRRLAYLCDTFGPRFSGSTNLEAAIDWVIAEMKKDGFENVRGEEVVVPRWVRGNESLELLQPRPVPLAMLGLGGSVATPERGLTAGVLVVRDFGELRRRAAEAKGRIVLFNTPFTEYHETVQVRVKGATEAARAGAVASLIRSIAPFSLQTPHTGNMRYEDGVPPIPHAAITLEDADMLERMQERGEKIVVRLRMEAQTLPDGMSRNVVAEVRGREHPDEIIVVSGHIDSWDVGTGAMDDGGGCLAAWEAARVMMKLNLRPRRTVRVVLWTNEENGVNGAKTYRQTHAAAMPNHVLALESDSGVFKPTGFGFAGSERAMPYLREIGQLLAPIGATELAWGCRGTDVLQLLPDGVPAMHLEVDRSRYFWYHHTAADTIDKLDLKEFQQCTAALAVMTYVVADMPARLPR